jgi:deoxyribodipyrimidine photolyase
VSAVLKDEGVETKYFWGSTLFHPDDLPFKLHEMPSNYGGFREKVQNVHVRKTIEAPTQLKGLPQQGGVKPGDVPSLQELGLNPTTVLRQVFPSLFFCMCACFLFLFASRLLAS